MLLASFLIIFHISFCILCLKENICIVMLLVINLKDEELDLSIDLLEECYLHPYLEFILRCLLLLLNVEGNLSILIFY